MPFVPVALTAEVELRYLAANQRCENTLYFRKETSWTASDLNTLGLNVIAWWLTNMAPLISTDVGLREAYCTSLASATAPAATVPAAPGDAGESAFPMDANNVSLAISFRTDVRGRSARGRNYIIGIPKQNVALSEVDSILVGQYVAAYDLLRTAPPAPADDWVVVSRFSGVDVNGDPIPRAAGVVNIITAVLAVDNTVDSQRRRLPHRGQ
jgi:hypothetical protein